MKTIHGSCKTCKFYDAAVGQEGGICRCHSPQVSVYMIQVRNQLTNQISMQPTATANFPQVGETCWCGEWQPGLIPMNG